MQRATGMEPTKTNSQIQKDVIEELRWDTRVDETDVGVEVDEGIVTLTGTVNSWAKKLAAQEAAHRVNQVRDVANNIEIKVPGLGRRTDTELAKAVRHALEWDVMVPDKLIHSTVVDGAVTLTGTVQHASQRADTMRALTNLDGVRHVTNHIVVRGPEVSPATIRRSIEDALERHAERAAGRIKLDIVDGNVTVSGAVTSWRERAAVLGAAMSTPGVTGVEDQVVVMS